jgi:adenylate cyclase
LQIFKELQRRNVFRVAIGYVISSWILIQVADVVLENIGSPGWVMQTIMLLMALGFPVAVFFSWAYEVTPEGLKLQSEIDRSQSITQVTGRKLDRAITVVLIVALAYFAYDKFVLSAKRNAALVEATTQVVIEQTAAESESSAEPEKTIAVLPFVNMSNDPDQDYFSDGVSEELLNALVKIEGLDVTSRTSAFAYKGSSLSIPQIAAELGVAYVLEGSVRKAENKLRITAQLIDTKDDRHLWSESYDRTLADIFVIQSEIANAIANALRDSLGMTGEVSVEFPVLTDNMSAYDLYMKGRDAFTYRARRTDITDSVKYLEQSLALDPNFIAAMETLAAAYSTMPGWWYLSPQEAQKYLDEAMALTDRVLEIDPDRSMAWVVRGSIFSNQLQDPESRRKYEEAFDRTLELDPRNVLAHHWRATVESQLGYLESARKDQERCLEIEPRYYNCMDQLMDVLTMLGMNDEAMELLSQRLEITATAIYFNGVTSAYMAGNRIVALALMRQIPGWKEAPNREIFAILDRSVGDPENTLEILEHWAEKSELDLLNFPELLALLGAPITFQEYSVIGWYWYPILSDFRQTEVFKKMMVENGMLEIWRQRGFPTQCRPLGEDDFECD